MKGLSHRQPRLFRAAAFLLGCLAVASLPLLLDLMSRAMTWGVDHLSEFQKHWEVPLWLR
jgi:hypothetical protein